MYISLGHQKDKILCRFKAKIANDTRSKICRENSIIALTHPVSPMLFLHETKDIFFKSALLSQATTVPKLKILFKRKLLKLQTP